MLHCIDERRASTNARAVGLEQVFAPQVDAGDEHPAYDAHDHAVGHHPACDAKAHTAGVCHPGFKHAGQNPAKGAETLLPGVETLLPVQTGVVVGDPACQAKGAAILLPGVAILLPVQIFPDDHAVDQHPTKTVNDADDHAAVISPACDAKLRR